MPNLDYRLAVDLDGVCGDYVAAFRAVVACELGVSQRDLPTPTTWEFAEAGWGIDSTEQFLRLHHRAVVDPAWEIFRQMEPMPGVAAALWDLSDRGVHIHVATARMMPGRRTHAKVAGDTQEWLDRHNIPYRSISFVSNKSWVVADLYVDDSPGQIAGLRRAGRRAVVFDQPYNRTLPGLRVGSWSDLNRLVRTDLDRWQGSR